MLNELYQSVIIDHNKSPRNYHEMPEAKNHAEGYNPLCGDKIHVYLSLENNMIEKISFTGQGCAISMASASMMTEALRGKTIEEALLLFETFHQLLTENTPEMAEKLLGKLNILANVKHFPTRVKCATLAWHTLRAALLQDKGKVSTEEV